MCGILLNELGMSDGCEGVLFTFSVDYLILLLLYYIILFVFFFADW